MLKKINELGSIPENECVRPITNKAAVEKLRTIDEKIASGKRKVMSETEFFCR